jgi:DNA invertase Pin-like site-specific DNA recombinase
MAEGKFISYIRVSTDKQGKSGLGLEAQKKAIDDFLNGGKWKVICEFVEIETGKNNERVELKKALKRCKTTGATLIIAKLDRLSRDSAFIGAIMKSDVEFIACDMPTANKFTIHILAAVAEHEAEMISARTKAALAAAKARGQVLGNPRNLNKAAAAKGRIAGVKARQNKADEFAKDVLPIINEFRGMSLHKIAAELNDRKILTARGKTGSWTASAVKNVLNRSYE